MKRIGISSIVLVAFVIAGCAPTVSVPAAAATEPQAAPASTAAAEAPIPAGWGTYTSQRCEYAISHPAEMQVTEETPYSGTLAFKPAEGAEAVGNFLYVSVITPEIQQRAAAGAYSAEVYNYDPAETQTLLRMQVGESKPVRELPSPATAITYERKPDATIDGHAAQAYENLQPWEFPAGTKEIRYYVSLDGCIYLIGGYVGAAQSGQPGTVTEELFNQVIATVKLMP